MARAHRLIMPAQHICAAGRFCPPMHYRADAPRLFSFQCPRIGEVGGIHERRFMAACCRFRLNYRT